MCAPVLRLTVLKHSVYLSIILSTKVSTPDVLGTPQAGDDGGQAQTSWDWFVIQSIKRQIISQQTLIEGLGERSGKGGRRCASLRVIQEQDTATSVPSGGAMPATEEGADQGLRVGQVRWMEEGGAMGSAATVGKPQGLIASLPGPGVPLGHRRRPRKGHWGGPAPTSPPCSSDPGPDPGPIVHCPHRAILGIASSWLMTG